MKTLTLLSVLTFVSLNVHAQETNSKPAAGKTMVARGPVAAVSESSANTRKLKRRSPIYGDDVVETGENGKAQLRMTDGGMIALKENSQLVISEYEYSVENGRGSVAMELLKGGLRSVTGSIKAESGDYKLKTPVGSIGIRGTHYEVEIVGSTIWVAVWDGAVDLDISSGDQAGSTLSLGQSEGFSYASIDSNGTVTTYIEPPETFESGMTPDTEEVDDTSSEDEQSEEQSSSSTVASNSVAVTITTEEDANEEAEEAATEDAQNEQSQQVAEAEESDSEFELTELTIATEDLDSSAISDVEQLIADRTGELSYGQVASAEVSSSAGSVSDFQMNMTIDFDNATIPEGNMSFTDSGGEWFATFDGVINEDQMALGISSASHGNNQATGEINAIFTDGIDSILGNFTLSEILNSGVFANGSFQIIRD